jgi:hypothetical protein
MLKKIFTLSIVFTFSYIGSVYAYLDPGTGGMIIQAIIAFIATAGAVASIYWKKIKEYLIKTKSKVEVFNYKFN